MQIHCTVCEGVEGDGEGVEGGREMVKVWRGREGDGEGVGIMHSPGLV